MSEKRMTKKDRKVIEKLDRERLQDPEFCQILTSRFKGLSEFLSKIEPDYRSRDGYEYNLPFKSIIEMLTCYGWAYPIVSTEIATSTVDRLLPMLIGPLFTSAKHPWPKKGRKFLEPVVQFDLQWAGRLANVNLGEGILQLWLGPTFDGHQIRVIPKDDFARELLAPIPKQVTRRHFVDGPFFAGDEGSWLDKDFGGKAVVITGIGKPLMTWHRSLRTELDDLAYNMADDNAAFINEFLQFLPTDLTPPTPHFFGVCRPVQNDPRDLPPCLLALESEGPFIWGDCGNAQIFYSTKDDETTRFQFDWSCY